jgi:hypothetical protein
LLSLLVEEARTILLARQGANFGAAEDVVPVAGYCVVACVSQKLGRELQKECGGAPEAWEVPQNEYRGSGSGEQMFIRQFMVYDDVNRV